LACQGRAHARCGQDSAGEALAKSCKVPLVEVTPSDIVIGGGEAARTLYRCFAPAYGMTPGAFRELEK